MKVVLDTNVLLAAFATRGLCDALLSACLLRHELVLSEYILTEVRRHLVSKLRMTETTATETVAFLRSASRMVEPLPAPTLACPDASDLPVLGTAHAVLADYLVTGDRALVEIGRYEVTRIVTPRAFYDQLASEPDRK